MTADHGGIRGLDDGGTESGRIVNPGRSEHNTGRGHIKGSKEIVKANRKQTGKRIKVSLLSILAVDWKTASTEVQRLSFVGSTGEVCCPYPLWNIQNLGTVPAYKRYYTERQR